MAYDLRDNAILHAHHGQQLMDLRRYREAVEEYKNAIFLNPGTSMTASLYNDLGVAYLRAGQPELAIASFQHACRLQPGYAVFYQNLINVYRATDKLVLAKQDLLGIVHENPDDAEAWFMLGLIAKAQGRIPEATTYFKNYLRLEPNSELSKVARSSAGQ